MIDIGYQDPPPYNNVGCYSSHMVDANNLIHISYQNCSQAALRSWGSGGGVAEASGTGFYTSIAMDSAGYCFISHYDRSAGDLRLAYRDAADRYSLAVDTLGDVGKYSSVAVDANGLPVISYYDATNGDLKIARYQL